MPTFRIPESKTVPGSSGVFDWWSKPPSDVTGQNREVKNAINYYPDNPDWLGAFSLSAGEGANPHMHFRAAKRDIENQPYLLLSWVIYVPPEISGQNFVRFLLGDMDNNYVGVRITVNPEEPCVAGKIGKKTHRYMVSRCTVKSGAKTISQEHKSDQQDKFHALEKTAGVWVGFVSPRSGRDTAWAFQVAVPLGESWFGLTVPTSDAFKLWYEVLVGQPKEKSDQEDKPIAYTCYSVPGMPEGVQTESSSDVIPQGLKLTNLLDMTTGNDGTDAVTISREGLGTRNVDDRDQPRSSATEIRLDLGKKIAGYYDVTQEPKVLSSRDQNLFFATPKIPKELEVKPRSLRARFSLANWGSQITDPTARSWRVIPGLEDVLFLEGEMHRKWPTDKDGEGGVDSFTKDLVRNIKTYLNFFPGGSFLPYYPLDPMELERVLKNLKGTGAQSDMQCMLVELSSSDRDLVISQSSAYQNMYVKPASVAGGPARISIEGLTPIGAQPRDVYLYLQTFNMPAVMPAVVTGPTNLSPDGDIIPSYYGEIGSSEAPVPTCIVHVYHDTGSKYTYDNGVEVPILRPQTSFGYFLEHSGDLYGWETRLYGAEKLADNFYRLRIPNDGAAYVFPAILARESVNDPPLPPDGVPAAVADTIIVAERGTATTLVGGATTVMANDTGLTQTPVKVILVRNVAHGTLTLNADGTFNYRHDGSENFSDSFTYGLSHSDGQISEAIVSITITAVSDITPAAFADSITVAEGGTATTLASGATTVKANDTGLIDTPVIVSLVSNVTHGTLTLKADGTFSYSHDGSENFTDSFTYRLTDNDGQTSDAAVSITITPASDTTPAAVGDSITVAEGGSITSLVGGASSVSANDTGLTDTPVNVSLVTGVAHGTLTLNADGTFNYSHDGSENLTDSFTYRLTDNDGQTSDAVVSITINPVSDSTPAAVADRITVGEGCTITTLVGGATSVRANDTDLTDTPVNVSLVTGVAHGTLTLKPDGTFSYSHDGSANFTDSFTYRLTDNDGQTSDAVVSISIIPDPCFYCGCLIAWLDVMGPVGRLMAHSVRFNCWLFQHRLH